MEIKQARCLATELMQEHGLAEWRVVFDNAKTRAGACRPSRREISLSRCLTPLHSDAEVRDTILHEIAHALVGVRRGHDAVWRAKAVAIGCTGLRCVAPESARPPAPWIGRCAMGHELARYRQPTRVMSCIRCSPRFTVEALIDWTCRGQQVPMHPKYQAELRQIRLRQRDPDLFDVAAGALGTGLASVSALPRIAVGVSVRLGGVGRFAGLSGLVIKRGRTRYHVSTDAGVVTAPFALVHPARPSRADQLGQLDQLEG